MSIAFVALGSNLGDSVEHVLLAFSELAELERTKLVASSSLYWSEPVDCDRQPHYVNAVAKLETSLNPAELLEKLFETEAKHGRVRTFPNAPRTLDLDLLIFDEQIMSGDLLTLPHPRMHERAFVLYPLIEIAPKCKIPGKGSAKRWLAGCRDQHVSTLRTMPKTTRQIRAGSPCQDQIA